MIKHIHFWFVAANAFLIVVAMVGLSMPLHAQVNTPTEVKLVNPVGGTILKKGTQKEKEAAAKGITDWPGFIGGIIKTGLGVIGSITLVTFMYGGFLWLTSAGAADRVQKGKSVMFWSAAGVFIIFSSYAIMELVVTGLGVKGTL